MNYFKKLIVIVVALAITFHITSCSTILYGRKEKVSFESTPAGADIFINDKSTGFKTPATIKVNKGDKYKEDGFRGIKFELRKEGYEPYIVKQEFKFHTGSFLLGGLALGALGGMMFEPSIEMYDYVSGYDDSPDLVPDPDDFLDVEGIAVAGGVAAVCLSTDLITGSSKKLPNSINANLELKNSTIKNEVPIQLLDTSNRKNLALRSRSVRETAISTPQNATPIPIENLREQFLAKLISENKSKSTISSSTNTTQVNKNISSTLTNTSGAKISKSLNSQQIDSNKLTFRRSSLYTLITNKEDRPYEHVIINAFGNTPLSEKFNDHNIGPYRIPVVKEIKEDNTSVTEYLNKNNVARDVVAKWFNRSASGGFNMDLVAERGNYDATEMRVNIAKGSARGIASISDAGEELIGNTFVIVYDFKFTNKEEVAAKAKTGLQIAKFASDFVPGGDVINTAADVGSVAATVAGKGYIIRTTSHLYRLVWNDSVANAFYDQMWTEDGNIDPKKKELFENTDLFTLKYVGYETAFADLQSTVFTDKSEEDLIRIATSKAADAAISKLQRKFEEFRTKSPLYTGFPITAKIGMKEGLEGGDKFEVLEQTVDENTGKTKYIRKGIITVDGNKIWDNRYMATEAASTSKSITEQSTLDRTYFKGSGKYYNGMLIRQIK